MHVGVRPNAGIQGSERFGCHGVFGSASPNTQTGVFFQLFFPLISCMITDSHLWVGHYLASPLGENGAPSLHLRGGGGCPHPTQVSHGVSAISIDIVRNPQAHNSRLFK